MKSYSDNIPNISTDEIKRSAVVTEETHTLVKDNLEAIEALSSRTNYQLNSVKSHLGWNTFLLMLTLGMSTVTLIINLLPFFKG